MASAVPAANHSARGYTKIEMWGGDGTGCDGMTRKRRARRKRTLTPEHIEAIRSANTGKVVSAETRARMSEAAKRRPPPSTSTRQRMSKNNAARNPVTFGGRDFHSQAAAARYWRVSPTTMSLWIRQGLTAIPKRKRGAPGRPLKRKSRKAR